MNCSEIAEAFFDRYRRHDIDGMLALCAGHATIDYVPLDAAGPAAVQGKAIRASLIDAFPDPSNEITALHPDSTGHHVTVEVTIGGTQARDFLGIANRGNAFSLKHAFIFELDAAGCIARVRAYRDNARLFDDLGGTTRG
ncbi:nuclear transport factor 2 family protein [Burkholderia sp. Bp9002]|nr:nuclear transport factor 2 family protein [Burkholderia sp. Bp9002]